MSSTLRPAPDSIPDSIVDPIDRPPALGAVMTSSRGAVTQAALGALAPDRRGLPASLAAEYPFDPHWIAVDGGRMHYVDEGPRGAPPLLLLHGNPTWSFFYRRLVRAFRGEQRVVAPDHLGCGLSDKPQRWAYTLESHIANLERLVLSLDLARITLVVHDWGGAIGFGFARRHPERIARLVILNSAAFVCDRIPLSIRVCRTSLFGSFLVRRLNLFARAATRMALETPGRLSPAARAGLLLPYDSYANRIATWRFVRDIPLAPGDPSWAELVAIDAALARFRELPACIVWGERDWCFTAHFRRLWEARFPAAEVHRLEGVGHYLLEEAPEAIEERLAGFFARNPVAS